MRDRINFLAHQTCILKMKVKIHVGVIYLKRDETLMFLAKQKYLENQRYV